MVVGTAVAALVVVGSEEAGEVGARAVEGGGVEAVMARVDREMGVEEGTARGMAVVATELGAAAQARAVVAKVVEGWVAVGSAAEALVEAARAVVERAVADLVAAPLEGVGRAVGMAVGMAVAGRVAVERVVGRVVAVKGRVAMVEVAMAAVDGVVARVVAVRAAVDLAAAGLAAVAMVVATAVVEKEVVGTVAVGPEVAETAQVAQAMVVAAVMAREI